MPNQFYNDFDLAAIESYPHSTEDYRTPFQIGRDRIIHTSAFRRLQGKTQVFFSGDYDFYRTRLTHSIEVAQIGRSICGLLQARNPLLSEEFFVDSDLVEAACLSHDIGHPPFGHTGEKVLNDLMAEDGGFEGNAQTLRLLTEIIFSGGTRGMNPARGLLEAVLKYRTLHNQLDNPDNHFIYSDQEKYRAFIQDHVAPPSDVAPGKELDALKSVECQIMDWADDTAYSLNDLADGINAGFITLPKLEAWASEKCFPPSESQHVEFLLKAIRDDRVEPRIGKKVGDFIAASTLTEDSDAFLADKTNRHRFRFAPAPEIQAEAEVYKGIAIDLVFRSPQLRQLDYKSEFLLTRLFNVFREAAESKGRARGVLPETLVKALAADDHTPPARRVCDFLASMTDATAIRTYKRLFDPDFGSLADLV